MRVLFIPDYSKGNPYQRELAAALGRLGIEVSMEKVAGRFPVLRAMKLHDYPDVLHIHWTHHLLFDRNRGRSIQSFRNFVGIFRLLLEFFIIKRKGTKLIWTVHNLFNHEKKYFWMELLFNKCFVRLCDRLIVHCDFAKDAVVKSYNLPKRLATKIEVIPHGHFVGIYKNEITREEARQKLGLTEREFVFLSFGRIRAYKGISHLLDIFRKMEGAHLRLLIAGAPSSDDVVQDITKSAESDKRIKVDARFIEEDEIQIYMNAADIVTLPYEDILTSGASYLAMSFGKPIIAPKMGCVKELLCEQGAILYDPSSEGALLEAMNSSLSADLVSMGEFNKAAVMGYDWNNIAYRLAEVYGLKPE